MTYKEAGLIINFNKTELIAIKNTIVYTKT